MNKIKFVLAALSCIMLSGCGVHKPYVSPEVDTEGLYRDYSDSAEDGPDNNFGSVHWENVFTDPYLQGLIHRALGNNTDMRAAYLKIEQSEAALKSAKLAFLPSFNISAQGGASSWDTKKAVHAYSFPVVASWEIDVFGRIKNAKRRARAVYEQSMEYTGAVQTWLIATVSNTYYTLLMLDAQLDVTARTAESWKENVRVTKELKKAGMATEAAVAQTEANYFAIEASLIDLKRQVYEVENALSLLLTDAPEEIERGSLYDWQPNHNIKVGLPVRLLSCRPDVRIAELAVEQAFYTTAEARAGYYPSLILSGSAGWTNDAGSMILNPGKLLATAVGSVTQSVFNAGNTRARVKISESQQQEALLNFERTVLNAGTEVINALKQIESASGKEKYRRTQINSLETAVKSTELLMRHGSSTYLEVLTAQQALLAVQLSEIADTFELIQGTVSLYHALGGGLDRNKDS